MAAIVDIDNTIIRNGIYPMQAAIAKVNSMPDVFLVTGRPESERAKTTTTLRQSGVQYKALFMNSLGPDPESQIRSKHQHATAIVHSHNVTFAADDNPKAQALYRSLGIKNVVGHL